MKNSLTFILVSVSLLTAVSVFADSFPKSPFPEGTSLEFLKDMAVPQGAGEVGYMDGKITDGSFPPAPLKHCVIGFRHPPEDVVILAGTRMLLEKGHTADLPRNTAVHTDEREGYWIETFDCFRLTARKKGSSQTEEEFRKVINEDLKKLSHGTVQLVFPEADAEL